MAEDGGTISRDRVFVNEIEVFGETPTLRLHDVESLPQLCRNAPDNGYTMLVVPAFGPCHGSFAENASNYEEMYMKPLVGWVAGIHLDDLGAWQSRPLALFALPPAMTVWRGFRGARSAFHTLSTWPPTSGGRLHLPDRIERRDDVDKLLPDPNMGRVAVEALMPDHGWRQARNL